MNEFQTGQSEQECIFKEPKKVNMPNIQNIMLTAIKRYDLTDAKLIYLSKIGNCIKIKIEGEGPIYLGIEELEEALKKLKE